MRSEGDFIILAVNTVPAILWETKGKFKTEEELKKCMAQIETRTGLTFVESK